MTTKSFVVLLLASLTVAKECTTCCDGGSGRSDNGIDYVQLAVQSAQGFCEVQHVTLSCVYINVISIHHIALADQALRD